MHQTTPINIIVVALLSYAGKVFGAGSVAPSQTPRVRGVAGASLPPVEQVTKSKRSRWYKQYEQDFNMLCQVVLEKELALQGKLTPEDYAAFFWDYLCDHAPNRSGGCSRTNSFSDLPVPIQLEFASKACSRRDIIDKEKCIEAINEDGSDFSFDGEVDKLCADTYRRMRRSDMLIDPLSDSPSTSAITTSAAPSFRPSSLPMTRMPVAHPPMEAPSLRPNHSHKAPTSVAQPTKDTNVTSDIDKNTTEPVNAGIDRDATGNSAKNETSPVIQPDKRNGMSAQGLAATIAVVVSVLIAKTIVVAMYVKSRKNDKSKLVIDLDPYLEEHSALGSEHSGSITVIDDDEGLMSQKKSLLKPESMRNAKDPLAIDYSRNETFDYDERSISLASSIFDERLLPYYEAIFGDNMTEPIDNESIAPELEETASQAASGTRNDPIAIDPTSQTETWIESRQQWHQSRDEAGPSESQQEKSKGTRRLSNLEDDSLRSSSGSRSSGHTSSTVISVDEEIMNRFREFDESVTGGIESLRSDLNGAVVDAASSYDTADDSISVHISRRIQRGEP